MNIEELTERFQDCLDSGNLKCFEEELEKILAKETEKKASQLLSQFLFNLFTTYKANAIAKLMEVIIRKNRNLALLKFPSNYLYRIIMYTGSTDLFECYIEEAIQPYLKENPKTDAFEFYLDLQETAEQMIEKLSEQDKIIIKGLHFNGAFGTSKQYPNAVLINSEDYEVLDDAVEKYNAVIGRKEILNQFDKMILEI